MVDVLVGEVGDTHDGALLDGILHVGVIDAQGAHLEAAHSIFLQHFGLVHLHLLNLESASDVGEISTLVVPEVDVLFRSFPKAEYVIFLYVPDTALGQCLEA